MSGKAVGKIALTVYFPIGIKARELNEAFTRMGQVVGAANEQLAKDLAGFRFGGIVSPAPRMIAGDDRPEIFIPRLEPLDIARIANDLSLAAGDWLAVDPGELTIDQRWQYQKLVMGAPVRWARRLLRKG